METIFKYNGNPVTFNKDGEVFINATEMARPFGKRVVDWQRLPSTGSFITALIEVRKSHNVDNLIITNKGGFGGGGITWMHEDVAIEFARWLSPAFAIWCNDRIKELLKVGMTAMPQTLEDMIDNPDLVIGLAQKLKEERAKVALLAPKAKLAEQLLASDEMFSMEQVAKMLFDRYRVGRNKLFDSLRDKKVLTNANLPTMKYMNKGYFYVREKRFGKRINTKLFVYNKGIQMIMELLNIDGYQQELMLSA